MSPGWDPPIIRPAKSGAGRYVRRLPTITTSVEPIVDPQGQYRQILRFVRRRAKPPTEPEDVVQEAFASAAESVARSIDEAPPTLAWLYTVARRRLIDETRRRRLE